MTYPFCNDNMSITTIRKEKEMVCIEEVKDITSEIAELLASATKEQKQQIKWILIGAQITSEGSRAKKTEVV